MAIGLTDQQKAAIKAKASELMIESLPILLLREGRGSGAVLKVFKGNRPPNCEDADPDGLLATVVGYTVQRSPAGELVMQGGLWNVAAAGVAVFFRQYSLPGMDCDMQGSVSEAGCGGDLVLSSVVVGGAG